MFLAKIRHVFVITWRALTKPFLRSAMKKKLRLEDIEFPNHLSPDERAELYARIKADFDVEQMQRMINGEEGIPMEEVLKELEEIHRQSKQGS